MEKRALKPSLFAVVGVTALVAALVAVVRWPSPSPGRRPPAAAATHAPSPAAAFADLRTESRVLARLNPPRLPRRRLQVVVHRVEPGDTLWSIAERYGTDVESVLASNDIDRQAPVAPGVELRVPPVPGRIYAVEPGDTLEAVAKSFGVTVETIVAANDLIDEGLITPGQELVLPGARQTAARAQIAAVSRSDGSAARYIWPARGPITSRYGPRWGRTHSGLDIGAPNASEVAAARRGVVVSAGWKGQYGLAVEVDHGSGVTTLYAHMSRVYVAAGEALQAGETIGLVGSTGESTGPHLHFEIRRNGEPIDPLPYLP